MSLNEPYATWFLTVVGQPAPDNPRAPCATCPRCDDAGFHPSLKCCTYIPALPNFQAGAALLAGGEGARMVRRQQAQGIAGRHFLACSEALDAHYDAVRSRFGAEHGLRCPYVTDAGRCAVWDHRNATCATWFCAHPHGPIGEALWDAATELFTFAEGGLAVLAEAATYEDAALAARSIGWDAIREAGGSELAELEQNLRDAYAAYSTVSAS